MASFSPMAFLASAQSPPIGVALSGIFGSVSMASWICLLLPQLIANYKAQSADGLSMGFLFIWLLGDVTNLAGALLTHRAPAATAIAVYFCIADLVLICQCLYYNARNARRASRSAQRSAQSEQPAGETEPLLTNGRRSSSSGLPGSHRRHAIHEETSYEPLRKIVTGEDDTPDSNPWLHNTLSIAAVWVVGAAGWFISYKAGAWDPEAPDEQPSKDDPLAQAGLFLGYISAVCYLCARIPQIIKNYREKSCEGLALLFFLLSLTGNISYGASLIAYSQDKDYLIWTVPWLVGSLGTMFEDAIIFVQFHMYSAGPSPGSTA
ncbi:vacuolar membrane PQ loop repeat protein [Plectosphaerella cucumerina]|uniref:Vacuolar membrane PQ loop repeat protein n=1 Tax=Plectosphaerella cucumerina TaxID=40658 RepID=A0A8K0THN4_9PEZI|nr:vacuolar membrane PQ loop repeat protein [Plectosphaerella cucumerina]